MNSNQKYQHIHKTIFRFVIKSKFSGSEYFLLKHLQILQIEYQTQLFFNTDAEITKYNVKINERKFFDLLLKSKTRTYGNIGKISNGRAD